MEALNIQVLEDNIRQGALTLGEGEHAIAIPPGADDPTDENDRTYGALTCVSHVKSFQTATGVTLACLTTAPECRIYESFEGLE